MKFLENGSRPQPPTSRDMSESNVNGHNVHDMPDSYVNVHDQQPLSCTLHDAYVHILQLFT